MTVQEEKALAEIERDILAAGIAKAEKVIFKSELERSEKQWLKTHDRLTKAINECDQVIMRAESNG